MGSLYKADVVRTALNEVGYQGGKGTSKYTRDLDNVNYWQMPAKDGCPDADWCSIFVNWCIWKSTRNSSGSIDPDKWDAHYFTFEPDSGENLAAGCGYAADYYMQHDAWSETSQGACVGDQVFFRNFAHTGIVVDWDDYNIYTVEGNASGYQVVRRSYSLDDPQIDGFGHPRYDGDEYPTTSTPKEPEKPKEEPKPEPKPETPKYNYIVTTNGGILRLRSAPTTNSAYLIGIPNGSKLKVSQIVDGQEVDGSDQWAMTCFDGYNGFVSCAWISEL